MRLFILGAMAATVMAGCVSLMAFAASYPSPRGHDGFQPKAAERVDYYWNNHRYHHRDWDRERHRWHYHD